ncbi:MAG: acid phosphatase [Sphingomonadaceae bacterium]
MTVRSTILALVVPLAVAAGTVAMAQSAPVRFDFGQPYIGGGLPGGEMLVGPPPADGSMALQRDMAASAALLARGPGPRWQMAANDADLGPGWFTRAFSCAAGRVIDDTATPQTARLLRRAAADFGSSTSKVKDQYMRLRPFMSNDAPTCTPGDEAALRGNGSYPSGHAAIGYGTGLLLASLLPDRTAQLAGRGTAFARSRAVCNVHWLSDTEAGEAIAAATFARLHANDAFRADWGAARAELAAVQPVPVDVAKCAAEAAALAQF